MQEIIVEEVLKESHLQLCLVDVEVLHLAPIGLGPAFHLDFEENVGDDDVHDEDVDLGQELLLVLVQLVGGDVAELGVLPDLVGGAGAHRGAVQVEAGLLVIEYDQDPRKYLQGINNLCKGEIAKINLNSAVTPSLSGMAAFFQLLGVGLDQLFFANLLLPSFFQPAEVSLATDLVTQ